MSEEKSPRIANVLKDEEEQCLPLPDEPERETFTEQVAENTTIFISDPNCAVGHAAVKLDSLTLDKGKKSLSSIRLIRTPFKSQSESFENKKTITPAFTFPPQRPALEVSPLYLRLPAPQGAFVDSEKEDRTKTLPDAILEPLHPDISCAARVLLDIRIPEIKKMLQNVSDLNAIVDKWHEPLVKIIGDRDPFAPYESKASSKIFEIQPTPESVSERNKKLLESWSYLRKCVGLVKEQVEKLLSWCEQATPESNLRSLCEFASVVEEIIFSLQNLVLLYMNLDKAFNFSGVELCFLTISRLNNLILQECFDYLSEVNGLNHHLQHIIDKKLEVS